MSGRDRGRGNDGRGGRGGRGGQGRGTLDQPHLPSRPRGDYQGKGARVSINS